jgi:hypothetical protein
MNKDAKKIWWLWYACRIEDTRIAHRILVGKQFGKWLLG